MTGSYTHQALELIFKEVEKTDQIPAEGFIRDAILYAQVEYDKRIEARGFRGILGTAQTEQTITEQKLLLAGMIWAFCRTILPWMLGTYRVIQAEVESSYVLDCSCGLLPTDDLRQHSARNCTGVALQLRQDVLTENRTSHNLAYFETKTTGWIGESWAPQWETKPQLALGTLGVQEKFGREVSELYIVGLYKGRRVKVEAEDGTTSRRQESPFVQGYCRPGNPPLMPDDWLPAYQWIDPTTGEKKTAKREYKKRSIAELAESDWPAARGISDISKFWIDFLPPSVVDQQVFLVGPMNRQDAQLTALKRQLVGEERRWQQTLWDLHEHARSYAWSSEEFQAQLDHLVPASWDCRPYGLEHECEFVDLCFKHAGWEDPLATGHYVPRRPHHQHELDQAIERGLLPAEADQAEERDE